MNIVQLQDQLKNFSQDQLMREMQAPSGNAPQFLVLGEIMRRQKMQQDFMAQQAKGDQSTVAQDAVAAAGVPQGGIADMARALAPRSDVAQNTGVKAMAAGGTVKKMAAGDVIVRGGKRYVEQEDGTYLSEDATDRIMTSGQNLARDASGIADALRSAAQPEPYVGPPPEFMSGDYTAEGILGLPNLNADVMPSVSDRRAAEAIAASKELLGGAERRADAGKTAATMEDLKAEREAAPAGAGPQYAADTVFDPITGVPIAGGAVSPEPEAGPSTGSWLQDLIQSEETKRAVQELRDRQRDATPGAPPIAAPTAPEAAPEALPETPVEPSPVEQAAVAAAAPSGGVSGGVGGGGGGGGGGGAATSYEQALMDALANREKAAQQDKWLALAQVGLNLMASRQPTLAGALGEAGLKGVEAMRAARDTYDKEKLDLLGALEKARASRAVSRGGGGGGAGKATTAPSGGGLAEISAGQGRVFSQINADIERLDSILSDPMLVGAELSPEQEMQLASAKEQRDALLAYRQQLLYGAPLSAGADDTSFSVRE